MPFVKEGDYWVLKPADKAKAKEVAAAFDDNFQQLVTDLAGIRSDVSANASAVAALEPRVAQNEADIVALQNRPDRVGWIRITDITPQNVGDTVSDKVFQDPPGNTIFQSGKSSSAQINIHVESSYPIVGVNGTPVTLTKSAGIYTGTIPVTLSTGDITVEATDPEGNVAAQDTASLTLDLPPVITNAVFVGGLPGSQTELKENDTYQLQITADKPFDQVVVADFGAAKADTVITPSGLSATITIDIADRGDTLQNLPARVSVRDAVTGALSVAADTDDFGSTPLTHLLPLNNLYPTVVIGSITYPGGQQALKGSEQATVSNGASDYDTILYDSPNSELSISNPSTFESSKTAQRIGGTYNVSTANFRVTATRVANAATTVRTDVVQIANVAATVSIYEPAARLRSGGNDGTSAQNHTITVQANQRLLSAPSLSPDSGGSRGTFVGSWTGGPSTWYRQLQVHDNDEKGTFSWEGLVATNLAGIVTNTISGNSQYVLGGFVARNLTFAAFATQVQMNVQVTDFAKLAAGIFTATNQSALKQAIGTPPPVTDGYTIQAAGVKPTTLIWLDTAAASTNSTGTAQITAVEETV